MISTKDKIILYLSIFFLCWVLSIGLIYVYQLSKYGFTKAYIEQLNFFLKIWNYK